VDFSFLLSVGGQAYAGDYYVGDDPRRTDDGTFTLQAGETAVFSMPVGANVTVNETGPALWQVLSSNVNGDVVLGPQGWTRTFTSGQLADGVADAVTYADELATETRIAYLSATIPEQVEYPVTLRLLVTVDGRPYVGDYVNDGQPAHADDGYVDLVLDGTSSSLDTYLEVPVGSQVTVTEQEIPGMALDYSVAYSLTTEDPSLYNHLEGEAGLTQKFTMPDDIVIVTFFNIADA